MSCHQFSFKTGIADTKQNKQYQHLYEEIYTPPVCNSIHYFQKLKCNERKNRNLTFIFNMYVSSAVVLVFSASKLHFLTAFKMRYLDKDHSKCQ